MIVARVEVWPLGDRDRAEPAATIYVANDGSGDAEIGHYEVIVEERDAPRRVVRLRDHRRGAGVVALLRDALNALDRG